MSSGDYMAVVQRRDESDEFGYEVTFFPSRGTFSNNSAQEVVKNLQELGYKLTAQFDNIAVHCKPDTVIVLDAGVYGLKI